MRRPRAGVVGFVTLVASKPGVVGCVGLSPSDGRAPPASGNRRAAEGDRQRARAGDNEGDRTARADRAEGPAGLDQRLSRGIIGELKATKGVL